MPGTGPQCGGAEGVIAMRRFGVIVALGALLSMTAGAATATPALAAGGRGGGWQPAPFDHTVTDNCGYRINITVNVDSKFVKTLMAPDGSTIFLLTGDQKLTWTNPANGKSVSTG